MSEPVLIASGSVGDYSVSTVRIKPVGKAPQEYHTTLSGERGAHSVYVNSRLAEAQIVHDAVLWTLYTLEVE